MKVSEQNEVYQMMAEIKNQDQARKLVKAHISPEYLKQQQSRITVWLKYNVKIFKSVTFTDYDISQMGSLNISGYINHDKSLAFDATVSFPTGEKKFEGSIGYTNGITKSVKLPEKTVSEIENIKKNDAKDQTNRNQK
ncbi:MAG: DUF1433 domain-containing protein [Sporolactobacillus sp.]